jgi:hypothetical protein
MFSECAVYKCHLIAEHVYSLNKENLSIVDESFSKKRKDKYVYISTLAANPRQKIWNLSCILEQIC